MTLTWSNAKSSHTITPLWHQMSPSQCNLQMKNWTLYEIRNNKTQRINVVHIENFILWTNHDKFDHWALALYDPIFQLQNLKYSTATFLICMPQELRSANHDLEIVNSSIYISPYWSPHHPQKSHWQESGLEMENYLRIYCFHRSSLPLDGVTMNVSWLECIFSLKIKWKAMDRGDVFTCFFLIWGRVGCSVGLDGTG